MAKVCEGHRRHSDHTLRELRECLAEVIACFGVYRTYLVPGEKASPQEVATVARAVVTAGLRRPEIDGELLAFLRQVLLLQIDGPAEREMVQRFQQVTGPVMAKAVEDTAFYRYTPLLALNEVGGDPGSPGTDIGDFHGWCTAMLEPGTRPGSSPPLPMTPSVPRMSGPACRCLSEMPDQWAATVSALANAQPASPGSGPP